MQELEQIIRQLKIEKERLEMLSEQRMEEIKKWKEELNNGYDQSAFSDQLNDLKRQLLSCRERIASLSGERNNLDGQVKSLQQE